MKKNPLVSIITPSFNQALYLEDTLRSVLEQDYPNIEYLVVDGGSTDGSQEIIQKYENRINWWVSEKDNGQAEAINKGFRRAQGEIVAWLNSDDMYAQGAIRKAVDALEQNEELGMVFSNVFSIDAHNEVFNIMRYGDWGLAELMAFNIIGQPGVFMRRAALEKAGLMDLRYQYLLDHQLWLRIAEIAPVQYMDETLAAARFHAAAKNVAMAAEFGREAFEIMDWMQTRPGLTDIFTRDRRKILAGAYRLSARYLQDGGRNGKALGHYLKSLWYHPATAWRENRRMLFALASLFLPVGRLRENFIRQRSQAIRADRLREYQSLFNYAKRKQE
jgi:glycosyltransferase involved in cell wall biosynthesis